MSNEFVQASVNFLNESWYKENAGTPEYQEAKYLEQAFDDIIDYCLYNGLDIDEAIEIASEIIEEDIIEEFYEKVLSEQGTSPSGAFRTGLSKRTVANNQAYAKKQGRYWSSSDNRTYANYNDALAAKRSRQQAMSQRQQSDLGKQRYAANAPGGSRYYSSSDQKTYANYGAASSERNKRLADIANKQKYAASQGKYYSSSDQKTYASRDAAIKARQERLQNLANRQKGQMGTQARVTSA